MSPAGASWEVEDSLGGGLAGGAGHRACLQGNTGRWPGLAVSGCQGGAPLSHHTLLPQSPASPQAPKPWVQLTRNFSNPSQDKPFLLLSCLSQAF